MANSTVSYDVVIYGMGKNDTSEITSQEVLCGKLQRALITRL